MKNIQIYSSHTGLSCMRLGWDVMCAMPAPPLLWKDDTIMRDEGDEVEEEGEYNEGRNKSLKKVECGQGTRMSRTYWAEKWGRGEWCLDFLRAKLTCCLRFSLPLQKDDGNRIGISASETICMSRNNDEHYSEGSWEYIAALHICIYMVIWRFWKRRKWKWRRIAFPYGVSPF